MKTETLRLFKEFLIVDRIGEMLVADSLGQTFRRHWCFPVDGKAHVSRRDGWSRAFHSEEQKNGSGHRDGDAMNNNQDGMQGRRSASE